MGKTLADAMNAQPGPDSLAYWLAPLKGYWDRQGRMANEGLQMADQGAQAVQAGNMGGLAGMLLGPAAYIGSPVSALFPERSEVEAATDVPEWSKPLIAGGLETMAIMAPGPKGKGLGKGLVQLADDATDAERAAQAGRLETEAVQIAPEYPWLKPSPQANYREAAALRMQIEPLETQLKNALQSKNATKAATLREKLKAIRDRVAQLSPGGPLLSAERVDEILKAHPNADLSAEDIDKMFPEDVGAVAAATAARVPDEPQALRNLTEAPEGILAYHGSPHTFDKFDMSKIGTGEGAQAYGHGLYFAENEGVADGYRRALGGKGLDVREVVAKHYPDASISEDASAAIYSAATHGKPDPVDAARSVQMRIADLRDEGRSFLGPPGEKGQKLAAAISDIREIQRGSMYQVRINAKPDEFLDWDRPLSEQPEGVRRLLGDDQRIAPEEAIGPQLKIDERFRAGSDQWLTDDLRKQGIKGIRYKDAGSRSGEGGTYNYVVFDDKIIDILKRYGIPMTVGVGGGVVVTGENMPPEIAAQMGPQA